ncbi:MAG: nuclear transport factor 2 family protein [Thermomicrobiales bacterium]
MTLNLPRPIATYLEADAAGDAQACAQCFTEDAVIHDESRSLAGHEAIIKWKTHAHAKYQYTVEPLGLREGQGAVVMHARLAGTFPGSPVEVDYRIVLRDGLIAELSID